MRFKYGGLGHEFLVYHLLMELDELCLGANQCLAEIHLARRRDGLQIRKIKFNLLVMENPSRSPECSETHSADS